MFSYSQFRLGLIIGSVAVLTTLFVAVDNMREPMSEVHWDAPTWMIDAKRAADTSYLSLQRTLAQRFAETGDIDKTWHFPDGYYEFTRLGHILLISQVIRGTGASKVAIQISTYLSYFFLLLGLALVSKLAVSLQGLFTNRCSAKYLWLGAFISLLLFSISPIFGYLGNSLVSEISALPFLSGSALTLVEGVRNRCSACVVSSGVLAFGAYFMRQDSIWVYLVFVFSLALILLVEKREKVWWPGFIAACGSAFALYLVYSLWFYPFANPGLFLSSAKIVAEFYTWNDPRYWYHVALPAGGLLWLGAILSMKWIKDTKATWLGGLWYILILVPYLAFSYLDTRRLTFIILPLMVLSIWGWGRLIEQYHNGNIQRGILWAMVGPTILMALISYPATYSFIREMPGLWRIQSVRSVITPVRSERRDYPIDEAFALSQEIYQGYRNSLLARSEKIKFPAFLKLIRFFGPEFADKWLEEPDAYLFPESKLSCAEAYDQPHNEQVVYCAGLQNSHIERLVAKGIRVLFLAEEGTPVPLGVDQEVVRTENYRLFQVGAKSRENGYAEGKLTATGIVRNE